MAELDTVIRNAVVATAADVFRSDIGIAGGVITALGRDLGPTRREIDAAGRVFHELPASERLASGRHRVRFVVAGDLSTTELFV